MCGEAHKRRLTNTITATISLANRDPVALFYQQLYSKQNGMYGSTDAMATLKAYESTAPSAEEIRVYLSRDPEYRRLDELQQKVSKHR